MTKNQIRKELAKIKIEFGNGLLPVVGDKPITHDEILAIATRGELANKGYLEYEFEVIEDDEGVRHGFKRGYRMTQKAKDLLEGV